MSEGQTQRIRRLREALFLVTDDTVLDIIEAVLAGARIDFEDDGLTGIPMTDPDNYILIINADERQCLAESAFVMLGQRALPLSPEAREIVEAVVGGADINDGWWYGTDCWSVIKSTPVISRDNSTKWKTPLIWTDFPPIKPPYGDNPCPTCGGRIENVFHVGCGNRLECVNCGRAKGE